MIRCYFILYERNCVLFEYISPHKTSGPYLKCVISTSKVCAATSLISLMIRNDKLLLSYMKISKLMKNCCSTYTDTYETHAHIFVLVFWLCLSLLNKEIGLKFEQYKVGVGIKCEVLSNSMFLSENEFYVEQTDSLCIFTAHLTKSHFHPTNLPSLSSAYLYTFNVLSLRLSPAHFVKTNATSYFFLAWKIQ